MRIVRSNSRKDQEMLLSLSKRLSRKALTLSCAMVLFACSQGTPVIKLLTDENEKEPGTDNRLCS